MAFVAIIVVAIVRTLNDDSEYTVTGEQLYQYDKEVLDIAVKRGWEKSASTAPCSVDYPRRVQIMVDKPKQNI